MGDQVGYDCEVLNDKSTKNIYDVCVMMVYVYYLYSVLLQTNYTASSLPAQPRYNTEQSPQYTSTTIHDHVGYNHLTKTFSHIEKIRKMRNGKLRNL